MAQNLRKQDKHRQAPEKLWEMVRRPGKYSIDEITTMITEEEKHFYDFVCILFVVLFFLQ